MRFTSVRPRCLTTAMAHEPCRTTASLVPEPRRPSAPPEDDEGGALLPGRLEDALGRASPDADHGAQDRLLRDEIMDPLEQPAGVAGLGGSPPTGGPPGG